MPRKRSVSAIAKEIAEEKAEEACGVDIIICKIEGLGFRPVDGKKVPSNSPIPGKAIDQEELEKGIEKLFLRTGITEIEITVIKKHVVEEEKLKEVAEALGLPVSEVRRIWTRAFKKMKRPICANGIKKLVEKNGHKVV